MDKPTCELAECDAQRHGRMPWCKRHYSRWRRTGRPEGRAPQTQHQRAADGIVTKECRTCKNQQPLDQYPPDGRKFDGLSSQCRECRNAYLREHNRGRLQQDPKFREQRSRYWQEFRASQGDEWARRRNREQKLRLYYGLTVEQYDAMLKAQGGRCAICGGTQGDADVRKAFLSVDHCHVTGRVRGLLCESCNFGLGKFRDDPELLATAIDYLRRTSA